MCACVHACVLHACVLRACVYACMRACVTQTPARIRFPHTEAHTRTHRVHRSVGKGVCARTIDAVPLAPVHTFGTHAARGSQHHGQALRNERDTGRGSMQHGVNRRRAPAVARRCMLKKGRVAWPRGGESRRHESTRESCTCQRHGTRHPLLGGPALLPPPPDHSPRRRPWSAMSVVTDSVTRH